MRSLKGIWINPLLLASLFFNLPVSSCPKDDMYLSFKEIIEEFKANSIVAEDKYMGQRITLINGEIDSIDDSSLGNSFVRVKMSPKNDDFSFDSVQCNHRRDEEIIRILRRGFDIDVEGTLISEEFGLSFNNCVYRLKELSLERKENVTCLDCLQPYTKNIKKTDYPATVKVKTFIGKSGIVKETEVAESSNNSTIDAAACRAAKSSIFYPLSNEAILTIQYDFKLKNSQ